MATNQHVMVVILAVRGVFFNSHMLIVALANIIQFIDYQVKYLIYFD